MNKMANTLRIGLIQLAVSANKQANLERATSQIAKAAREGKAQLVALPVMIALCLFIMFATPMTYHLSKECFNSPYGVQHFPEYAEPIPKSGSKSSDIDTKDYPTIHALSKISREANIWLIGGSIPEKSEVDGKLYNTSPIFSPQGDLIAVHRKIHLFDINIPGKITFKESAVLSPGNQMTIVDLPWGKVGVGICYDIRFAEMAMIAARKGCSLMVYPGAFNMTTGPLHWEILQRARAVDNQMFVATISPARDKDAGYAAWGHSSLINPSGQVMTTTDEKESIIYGTLDLNEIKAIREGIPISQQRRFDVYPDIMQHVKS